MLHSGDTTTIVYEIKIPLYVYGIRTAEGGIKAPFRRYVHEELEDTNG